MESKGEIQEVKSHARVWKHTLGFMDSVVTEWMVELRLADIIHNHGRPITVPQLASSLTPPCTNTDFLRRMMRYLAHLGLFTVAKNGEEEEIYSLTSDGKYLLKDAEKSIVPMMRLQMLKKTKESMAAIGYCLQGEASIPAFERVHGESLWSYASKDKNQNNIFNEAMASSSRTLTPALIGACKETLEGIRSLVDVGGGTGTALYGINKEFPHIKCTVFDLPHVVETSPENPGIDCVAGDMFSFVPQADAVLLMCVLHDWADEECLKILKNCKKAIPETGKLIIVDIVVDIGEGDDLDHVRLVYDMMMVALAGGKERTEKEWRKLLSTAGFSGCKIKRTLTLQSVIEAFP
ncbi:(RS)-norcoclaurine 6-O-methyltransferase-like [Tasmannia lanceolata]|uniref:(RS)-norcoclaurine 6-O-methyltransferase-like n=1 Tax=Tasmannia lanceolata TaxID=3420 RepID=UPI0040645CCB